MRKIDTFLTPPAPPKGRQGDEFELVGSGTELLTIRRPGFRLKSLTGVRVGEHEMPLTLHEEYPTDLSENPKRESVEIPLVSLREEAGEQVLVRSVKSNDGIWQDGARFVVSGVWEKR